MSRLRRIAIPIVIICANALASAEPVPLSFSPSPDWHGADGDWSAVRLLVGQPQQQVDVIVSTSLSEIWLLHDSTCSQDAACIAARGGSYNADASTTWSPLGPWQLSLSELGFGGNGDYALENVATVLNDGQENISLNSQLVATFNGSSPSTGYFGLGIVPQAFNGVVQKPPISKLVERDGLIPSHSYGFTAGARHIGNNGIPASLILGGYDESRFVPHGLVFPLNRTPPQPEVRLLSITASVSDVRQAPTPWSTPTQPLLFSNESVSAVIDSSTPYLWLPQTIADRFAASFNLVWSDSFKLYTFKDAKSATQFSNSPTLTLTFTVSSFEDVGDAATLVTGPTVLNLTISGSAFLQSLRYPFMNLMKEGDAQIPYFPLRRADNDESIIIGRAFLQETYLITNYETQSFAIYQARFPDNPASDAIVVPMPYTANSPYPGPPRSQSGFTTAQIAGTVSGACVLCIAIGAAAIWLRKRHKRQLPPRAVPDPYQKPLSGMTEKPNSGSYLRSLLPFKLGSSKAGRPESNRGLSGSTLHSSQNFSHKSYDRFSSQDSANPIEMSQWGIILSENGTGFTARHYEDWTLYKPKSWDESQGQASAKWTLQHSAFEPAKTAQDSRHVVTNHDPDAITQQEGTQSSISSYGNPPSQNLIISNPPIYGHSHHYNNIPSPVPLLQVEQQSDTDSLSSTDSYDSELDRQAAQMSSLGTGRGVQSFQGTGAQQSQFGHTSKAKSASSFDFVPPVMPSARRNVRHSTSHSLGSNFTLEEEERNEAWRAAGRLDRLDGDDLVHVPQPAERRYSWEA